MNQQFAYSISQVLEMVPVGRTTLYHEISQGRLKAKKIGRRTLILAEDLERFIENLPHAQGATKLP